ncbi:stage II sporulation protein M [Candidatus Woesearchaeota archaeon]|nr:stage II sporulation protein M [Candidatus Woesearchaeota archaeon]
MVVESIISGIEAERHPWMLVLFGFALSILAIFFSLWIFADEASMVFLFLIVMGSIPIMYHVIKLEEKKDVGDFEEVTLLKEHWKALKAFMSLFIGITLAVTAWYIYPPIAVFLTSLAVGYLLYLQNPKNLTTKIIVFTVLGVLVALVTHSSGMENKVQSIFETQIQTFNGISGGSQSTGHASGSLNAFSTIFFNNVKVLIFCVLFSFIYGAGAIFILTWNASVIGVAMGNYIRSGLSSVAHLVGMDKASEYFGTITFGIFRYVIHGIPEILAYFVAALAGGIISVAVIKHDFEGRKFEHIVLDAADLLLLSLALIFVAAILEVWITPLIF